MKISTTVPMLSIDGTLDARLNQGSTGIGVRTSNRLSLSRDVDGSWLVYTTWGDRLEDTSASLEVYDPEACAAFDALFSLLADPRSFEKRTIGEPREIVPDVA